MDLNQAIKCMSVMMKNAFNESSRYNKSFWEYLGESIKRKDPLNTKPQLKIPRVKPCNKIGDLVKVKTRAGLYNYK